MKVFISYAHSDKDKAFYLKEKLEKNDYQVLGDFNLKIGEEFKNILDTELLQADAVILLITEAYAKSKFASNEAETAYAYKEARKKLQILPVVFDPEYLPDYLSNILYLPARDANFDEVVIKLFASLNVMRDDKESIRRSSEEKVETFKISLAGFIRNTLTRLEKNEKRNRILAYICYILSSCCLGFSVFFSLNRTNIAFQFDEWQVILSKIMSGVLTLVLILALGRLLFILGKSFMVEAIRNSDRIHAISFGEFYLNAYGHEATRDEVREVFGNWNIDIGSSFMSQSPKDYDPQILENIVSIAETIKNKS